jgi:hypothetical protein
MSKIDRHSDLTSSREEQRILMRALGCGVEELVARLGRRARSSAWKPNCDAPGAPAHESSTRSGAPFSSGSRPRQTSGGTRSPHEARGIWLRRVMTRGHRIKGGARRSGLRRRPFGPPPLGGASADEHAPCRGVSLFLDPWSRAGLGSNVVLAILGVGIDGAMGRNAESSLPERAMATANTYGDMQRHIPAKDPAFVIAASRTKRLGR